MTGPKKAIIEVSRCCNARCIMCGFQNPKNFVDSKMSFEVFKHATSQSNFSQIRLNGRGESTTNSELLLMLDFAGSFTQTELFTNGNYDNEALNTAFIKYKTQLFFSIDSPIKKELEAIRRGVSFEKLLQNIKSQKENPTRPYLCFTLQEANINRIIDIAKFACENLCNITYNVVRRDEGIESFVELIKKEKTRIKEDFLFAKRLCLDNRLIAQIPCQIAGVELFEKKEGVAKKTNLQRKACPSLSEEVFIAADGAVMPCNMFNPYLYGNINEKSFFEIWNGQARAKFLKTYKDNYYCKNCACMGGDDQ